MGDEPVAIIGRNGMGKTTLCDALMADRHHPTAPSASRGEVRRAPAYKIAAAGIGFVPQGRRLSRR